MCGGVASVATPPVDNSKLVKKETILVEHKCLYPGCKRKPFRNLRELKDHVKFKHLERKTLVRLHIIDNDKINKKKKKRAEHKCLYPGCKRKPFRTRCELKDHVKFKHLERRTFVCLYTSDNGITCGKAFETRGDLLIHTRTPHTDMRPKVIHKCPYSDCKRKPFYSSQQLQLHIDFSHLPGIKHFVCDYIIDKDKGTTCGEAFETRGQCDAHKISRHSDVRPHECTGCSRTFKYLVHLKDHMVCAHSPPNDPKRTKYKCSVCKAGFITSGNRDSHFMRNHEDRASTKYKECMDKRRKYYRERRKNDPQYRAICNLRKRLGHFMNSNGDVKADSTLRLIGCELAEFVMHLNNNTCGRVYGGAIKYHIDHIRPMASFDFVNNPRYQFECQNFNNFQLLTPEENKAKGAYYNPEEYAQSNAGIAIAKLRIEWDADFGIDMPPVRPRVDGDAVEDDIFDEDNIDDDAFEDDDFDFEDDDFDDGHFEDDTDSESDKSEYEDGEDEDDAIELD
jgi:hypothetical protein